MSAIITPVMEHLSWSIISKRSFSHWC